MSIKDSKAYEYCKWCLEEDNNFVGIYIKKQAKSWINIADGNDDEAYVSEDDYEQIVELLKLMIHPDLGCTIYEGFDDYQHLLVIATLCTRFREDESRYYETALLEISRKNFKTFVSGVIFIIGMLIEPQYSRFFSVAPDYKLSNELRLAVRKIIKFSPLLVNRFKVNRDMIQCKLTEIDYVPLAYSNDGMDGKLANIFLADECGLLDDYPVEAMRSSQITLKNKLGIIISTQYPNDNNVFVTEVDVAKRTLDGLMDDRRYFSLLYEPDKELLAKDVWQTNDYVIYQSNPVTVNNKKMFDAIVKKRTMAILYASKRENYLCKHNNILYKGLGVDGFISSDQIQACNNDDEFDWNGRDVFIGGDGAETSDNSSIAMVCYDEETETVHSKVWCFVQEDYIEEKSKTEKFNYQKSIDNENTIICGDSVLDYEQFEQFVIDLPSNYGVNIIGLGYDFRNLRNSAQRLEREHYITCVEVKQHSSVLHPTIKWLKELVLNKKYAYSDNKILESNFTNCRVTEDANLNKYIHKKISVKTAGKVDMVFALINAMYLLQEQLYNGDNFVIQT